MTVRELVKILDGEYAILTEDLIIAKQLLTKELPTHSLAINSCNSWKELYDEIKLYWEIVETSVGKYRCTPNPVLIINRKHNRELQNFEVKRMYVNHSETLSILI